VLLAVASAACLVALAAASAPLLRAGAESEALKGKLELLTPLNAGATIRTPVHGNAPAEDRGRRAAVEELARGLPFAGPPVLTTMGSGNVGGAASEGGIPLAVVVMSRTGATAHVHRLEGGGRGAWIAGSVSKLARAGPGDDLTLLPGPGGAAGRATVRVGAVYRQLDQDLGNPYWVDFTSLIRAYGVDPPPLPTFVLLTQDDLYRVAAAVDMPVSNVFELPVDVTHMTPARAREIGRRFEALRAELNRSSPLARRIGCENGCTLTSSLTAAVTLADKSVSALTPLVSLLAGFALVIAFGGALVAGAFGVRRRAAEARLSAVAGESRAVFGLRAALEAALPAVVGAGAGLAIAAALVRAFAPAGTIEHDVVVTAALSAAGGCLATIVAVALGGAVTRGSSVEHPHVHAWRRIPWEVPVLIAAGVDLVVVERGGALVKNESTGAHPRLIVLLVPLLLAAGVAGLAVRGARRLLRASSPSRTTVFLAVRRLAAARALLVLLTVTAAVAFAALTFASVLRSSLASNSEQKAYVANGSDVQGIVDPEAVVRSATFPVAKVEQSFGSARLDDDTVEVQAVDPAALARAIVWRWSGDPVGALHRLAASTAPVPAIAVGAGGGDRRTLWVGGKPLPLTIVARVPSFPGQVVGEQLVVVPRDRLARAAAAAGIVGDPLSDGTAFVWAKGDPKLVQPALARAPYSPTFLTSVDHFLQSADLTTADRTYGYLRVVALGAGIVAVVSLLLYLMARSRSQALTGAFLTRMGMRRRAQAASLALEAASLAAFPAVLGAAAALITSARLVTRVDPLPQYAPGASAVVPWTTIAVALALLVASAAALGALATVVTRRERVAEVLRVA
jgi:putative ABC transport system permease protein